MEQQELSGKEKKKLLLTEEVREDLKSLLIGFDEMCRLHFLESNISIVPAKFNSDKIENHFGEHRSLFGPNTNPTYSLFCNNTNGIIIGDSIIPKKANANSLKRPAPFTSPLSSSLSAKPKVLRI